MDNHNNENCYRARQCESFYRIFRQDRREPLDAETRQAFVEFVTLHPRAWEWAKENNNPNWDENDGEEEAEEETLINALHLYLWWSIRRRDPLPTYRDLIATTVATAPRRGAMLTEKRDLNGLTLFHLICRCNPTDTRAVRFFLDQYPGIASVTTPNNITPLYMACTCTSSATYNDDEGASSGLLPSIRLLVGAYPQALRVCHLHGCAPLHTACMNGASLRVIEYLVRQEPVVCLMQDSLGNLLPLDHATRSGRGEDPAAYDEDVIAYLSRVTRAAAGVLTSRLRTVRTPPPPEIFRKVASYMQDGPEEIAVLKVAFRREYIHELLLGRQDIRDEIRAAIVVSRE